MFFNSDFLINSVRQVVHINAADTRTIAVLAVLLPVFCIFSFSISGSQVAFFSFGIKDINLIKTKSQPAYKRILDLLERPQELLCTLQIAAWFFYLAIIFTSNFLIDRLIVANITFVWMLFAKAIVIFVMIFLFGECLPKAYAMQANIRFAKDFGIVTEIVYYFFKRMGAWLLKSTTSLESAVFKKENDSYYYDIELNSAINLSSRDASEEEKRILQGVLKINKITVKQIMKSRMDISGIDYNSDFSQTLKRIRDAKYARLPVYEKTPDKIVGLINIKELIPHIHQPAGYDWHKHISPVYFVHEHKPAGELLQEFQEKHTRFAVVVDEFGGTSGIITLRDIQKEIVGEIDSEAETCKKIDDYNFIFNGKTTINDVCRIIGIPFNTFDTVKGNSESLAGLVLEIAGEIPQTGQVINSGDFNFSVEEINKNRLQKIRVMIDLGD